MTDKHPRKILQQKIIESLPVMVQRWQDAHPDCLIRTQFIVANAAKELGVTRHAIYKHLTEAVHEGRLIEVLMYRTWQVSLPEAGLLPKLYAVPNEDAVLVEAYKMVTERPVSRGSDGNSFLTTPDGYVEFMRLQRAAQYKRIPPQRGR